MRPASLVEQDAKRLLEGLEGGADSGQDRWATSLYRELHRNALRHMRGQGPEHTLQATALVSEAYLRMKNCGESKFRDRAHFLGVASRAMRSVLVDHARRKMRSKRSAPGDRLPLDVVLENYEERGIDLVAFDDALSHLEQLDPQMAKLVELRYFGGMTMQETADTLGLTRRQADRHWSFIRNWLRTQTT